MWSWNEKEDGMENNMTNPWTCSASTDSYKWITLTFQQNPYSGNTGYIYRSKSISTPIRISTINYYSGINTYPDDPGEPGGYYYWIEDLSGERSLPFYGIKLGGEIPSSSLSYSTEILTTSSTELLTTSSSSLSTELRTTSSSSFGDAKHLFYFLDKFGNLYSLLADAHQARSSLVFKSFSPILNLPMGLAISYSLVNFSSSSTEVLSSSSSSLTSESSTTGTSSSSSPKVSSSSSTSASSSSPSSSCSSESTGNYDYSVYILRKKNNTTTNLAIHNMEGYLKGSIDFSSSINFLGMVVWPGSSNLLVAISKNYIHMLIISSGQIGVYSFESPVELVHGIGCKNIIDENNAEFFVKAKYSYIEPPETSSSGSASSQSNITSNTSSSSSVYKELHKKELLVININKKDRNVSIVNSYDCQISKWNRIGGITCKPAEYGLIGEMDVVYQITEEEKGRSHLYTTNILPSQVSTSFLTSMPFTTYGMSIPAICSEPPSLLESPVIPTLTFRRYDTNGVFIEQFRSLFMGNFQPGAKSAISVVNILASGLTSISNLKIGIIEGDIGGADVSNTVLYGVTETIEPSFVPVKYFPGVNETNTSEDANNIEIGMKSSSKSIESKYLYLQINVPEKFIGRGWLTFRLFFDYE